MDEPSREQVLTALRAIRHPRRGDDVVSLGMISGVVVKGGHVGFAIEVEPERGRTRSSPCARRASRRCARCPACSPARPC